MFDRWLALWSETAIDLLDAPCAAAVVAKAERIAESLKLALFFRPPPNRPSLQTSEAEPRFGSISD